MWRPDRSGAWAAALLLSSVTATATAADAATASEAAAGPPSGACSAPGYRIQALPLVPAAINGHGQVAGTTEAHRAAVWSARDGLVMLPLPPGFVSSEAVAINGAGHVAFIARRAEPGRYASFVAAAGELTLLAGEEARVRDLNEAGQAVGDAVEAGGTSQPVRWIQGRPEMLGGCCGGAALRINAAGAVAAQLYDAQGRYRAFLGTPPGAFEPVGPAALFSRVVALNDRGHAVIQVGKSAVLVAGGETRRLALAPHSPAQVLAMNACDTLVGTAGPFADAHRAFVWDAQAGFRDLNTLIPADSGWTLSSAVALNDAGAIVGSGYWKHAENTGFLLVPR